MLVQVLRIMPVDVVNGVLKSLAHRLTTGQFSDQSVAVKLQLELTHQVEVQRFLIWNQRIVFFEQSLNLGTRVKESKSRVGFLSIQMNFIA